MSVYENGLWRSFTFFARGLFFIGGDGGGLGALHGQKFGPDGLGYAGLGTEIR